MRIQDFNIEKLPKPSLKEFGHNFVEEAEAVPSVTSEMKMWWSPVSSSFSEVERIYLISHKSDLTEDLQTLRSQRYGVHSAFKSMVQSYLKSSDAGERQAAVSLWNTMGSFPVKPNVTYNIQTGQFDALLEVLQGRQAENVAKLSLGAMVDQMAALNRQFHALLDDRNVENIDKTQGDFQFARNQFQKAYRAFVEYVNAYYLVKCITEKHEDAKLKFFIEKTNSVILNYKRTVLKQPTQSPEAGDTEANPDDNQTPEDVETPDGEPVEPETPGTTEPSEPETPEPSNPGNGGGSTEPSEPLYTIAWYDKSTPIQWYELPEGAAVPEAPEPPAGHRWAQTFTVMPARDVDIVAVAI